MEPTRIELDLPVVVLNRFGNLELPNHKSLSDMLSNFFPNGTVLTVHVVAETTGDTRGFCKFVDQTSTYKSECGWTLNEDGTCSVEESHQRAREKYVASPTEDSSK